MTMLREKRRWSKWFSRFKNNHRVIDDKNSRRPGSFKTDNNFRKIQTFVLKYRRQFIGELKTFSVKYHGVWFNKF